MILKFTVLQKTARRTYKEIPAFLVGSLVSSAIASLISEYVKNLCILLM